MLFFRISSLGGWGINKAKRKQDRIKKAGEKANNPNEHAHGPKITNGQRYN